jgi:hypothetical protein
MAMRALLALLALAAGCATGSAATTGPTVGYTDGTYFWLQHVGAQSGGLGARFAPGGEIKGVTCGMDVFYDVWLMGPSARNLTGFVRRAVPGARRQQSSHFVVRDRGGFRRLEGTVGETVGTSVVDLRMTPGSLTGRVAQRRYDLRAAGNDLVGTVVGGVITRPVTFVAHGRAELWQMSPEMQAVLVPFLLSCVQLENYQVQSPMLEVDFTGRPPDAPGVATATAPQQ